LTPYERNALLIDKTKKERSEQYERNSWAWVELDFKSKLDRASEALAQNGIGNRKGSLISVTAAFQAFT